MNRARRHLSYANVMSSIAVFAVLGGGAWAASQIGTADIQNGAVTKKKLHRDAVATKKIKNNAVTGAKVREGSLATVPRAASADAAATAAIADSARAADVASIGASPLAYAHVAADGTVDAANSRGVTNANILDDLGRAGTYCVTGLAGVKSAIVVADQAGANPDDGMAVASIHLRSDFPDTPACAGARFMISTGQVLYAGGLEPADASFFVWFFG